jgi:RNAse (barnase) inhibitor barstar
MLRKTIIINGKNFSTPDEFYDEVDLVLTKNLDWQTGHNLSAFNDLLSGGFGVHEYGEAITLIWKNSSKSKVDLRVQYQDKSLYYIIVEIITAHLQIEFIEQ